MLAQALNNDRPALRGARETATSYLARPWEPARA